jgi:predicted transposase YdaD
MTTRCESSRTTTRLLIRAADVVGASSERERAVTLLGAAATLASIVLPRPIIKAALKEAAMPVPVRDTPLSRELYDEGRDEGRHEGRREGRQEGRRGATVDFTAALLEERFGPDERIPVLAERLADLDDRTRVRRITSAAAIEELADPYPR